jgi:HEAT repeat protein
MTAVRGDPEPEVRLAAVKTLGQFGADAKAAMKVLEAAKSDTDQRIREAACDTLDRIK